MRLLFRSFVLALFCAMTTLGQTAPSAENSARAQEILKLARAAIGDESKLSSLKSLSLSGSSRRILNDRETQSEVEFEVQFPDKIRRSTVATPFPGAEFQNIEVINGDQVWFDLISSMPPGVGFGGGRGPGGGPGAGGGRMGGMQQGMIGDEASRQVATRAEFTRLFLSLLAAPPPSVQVEYSVIGEAKAPDGVADVIEVKGPGETKTRVFVDRVTHRILMLSYRGKDLAAAFRGGRGGPGGGPGGGPRTAGPGAGQAPGQRGQAGQGQAGQGQGQAGQPPAQPQMSPEEREQRRLAQQQRMQEAIAKAPDVDFFWRFADYKSEGGLNLPRLITKSTGDKIDEEWQISKVKVNANIKPDRFEKKDKK